MRLALLLTAFALAIAAPLRTYAQVPDDSPLVDAWTVTYTHGKTFCDAAPFPIPVPNSPDETAVIRVVESGKIAVTLPQGTNVMQRVPSGEWVDRCSLGELECSPEAEAIDDNPHGDAIQYRSTLTEPGFPIHYLLTYWPDHRDRRGGAERAMLNIWGGAQGCTTYRIAVVNRMSGAEPGD